MYKRPPLNPQILPHSIPIYITANDTAGMARRAANSSTLVNRIPGNHILRHLSLRQIYR